MLGRPLQLLMALTGILVAGRSEACLPEPPTTLMFERASDAIARPEADKVTALLGRFRHLDARCVHYEITGFETDAPLARSRAEATLRLLTLGGARVENMTISVAEPWAGYTPPHVAIGWRMARGTWRCKPLPPRPAGQPGPPCPEPNTACYLELADGTICNLHRVSHPSPQNYPLASPS